MNLNTDIPNGININGIKSRLGSIPAAKVNVMPAAQKKLLQEDLPTLIDFYVTALTAAQNSSISS